MRWAERIERGRARSTRHIAYAVALLAFAVRFLWVMRVQSPFDALYSDMGGYHARALDVLDGTTRGDPRNYAFFPWGTHVLVALELAAVGRGSQLGIAVVHAVVSTLPVVCVVFFMGRLVRSRVLIVLAGLVAALWQPAIVHVGFFMSEMWFSAAIVVGSLLLLRFLEGKSGALGAGCAFAVAVAVRPQALLTLVLVLGLVVAGVVKARRRSSARGWLHVGVPIVLVLAASAVRMHDLTGQWGLVSENGPLNRVFGATHIGRVEAHWRNQYGEYGAWYTPPAKMPVKPQDVVAFEGYIGDAAILDRIREEHVRRETRAQRLRRMYRNTRMLVFKTVFPESDTNVPERRALQRWYRTILVNMLPVGAFGLLAMVVERKRRRTAAIVLANALTVVLVAALYFAEARMRMPYDPFVITCAAFGLGTIFRIGKRVRSFVVNGS